MEFIDLPPLLGAAGTIRLPGSKSISNRVLLLAALAEGTTEIHDLLSSDDVDRMLEALSALGVRWQALDAPGRYRVEGVGGPFPVKQGDLFLGNAHVTPSTREECRLDIVPLAVERFAASGNCCPLRSGNVEV